MNESQKQLCAELWELYEPQLRKVCNIKLVGEEEEKEEVLSETFLILCKKIDQDGDLEYPQAWLYATLNNLIKQKYTEKNKAKVTYVAEYAQIDLPYEYDMVDEIFDEETLEELKGILKQKLTADEKQLLYYIIHENKTYKEIAELTATNENSVKQRKYRLFNKIKKLAKKKI